MIKSESLAGAYSKLRLQLLSANLNAPRGMLTKEIVGCGVHILNPRDRLAYHPERKFNLPFAVAEFLAVACGDNDVKTLAYYNPQVKQFSDDKVTFYGAYGPRVMPFLGGVIRKLKLDPDSRQAVVSIYKSEDTFVKVTKDVPCTLGLHFLVRDNKLDLIAYMRSNDLFWGFQYDVFVFTMIQEVVANVLGIDVGEYRHFTSSMHVYERHFQMLEDVDEMLSVHTGEMHLDEERVMKLRGYSRILTELNPEAHLHAIRPLTGSLKNIPFAEVLCNHYLRKSGIPRIPFQFDEWASAFMKAGA